MSPLTRAVTRAEVNDALKTLSNAKRYLLDDIGPWSTTEQIGEFLGSLYYLQQAEHELFLSFSTSWFDARQGTYKS